MAGLILQYFLQNKMRMRTPLQPSSRGINDRAWSYGDLEEIYQLNPMPSFSHPLQNLKKHDLKELPKKFDANSPNYSSQRSEEQYLSHETSPFFDPLGVEHNLNKRTCNQARILTDEASIGVKPVPVIDSGHLTNTLSNESRTEYIDPDPDLPGFRPWKTLRQKILEGFKTEDQLVLETSYLSCQDKR